MACMEPLWISPYLSQKRGWVRLCYIIVMNQAQLFNESVNELIRLARPPMKLCPTPSEGLPYKMIDGSTWVKLPPWPATIRRFC